jgi:hypothetical protein
MQLCRNGMLRHVLRILFFLNSSLHYLYIPATNMYMNDGMISRTCRARDLRLGPSQLCARVRLDTSNLARKVEYFSSPPKGPTNLQGKKKSSALVRGQIGHPGRCGRARHVAPHVADSSLHHRGQGRARLTGERRPLLHTDVLRASHAVFALAFVAGSHFCRGVDVATEVSTKKFRPKGMIYRRDQAETAVAKNDVRHEASCLPSKQEISTARAQR